MERERRFRIQITDDDTGELLFNRGNRSTIFFVAANDFDDIKCGELSSCTKLDYTIHLASLVNFTGEMLRRLPKEERHRFKKVIKDLTMDTHGQF